MPTFSIKSEVTMSTERTRVDYASLYKSFNADSVNLSTLVVAPSSTHTLDTSNSNFLIVVPDDYGLENEVFNVILNDGVSTFTLSNVGYFMTSTFNVTSVVLQNTGTEPVEVVVVY